jgi:hypothetical protein
MRNRLFVAIVYVVFVGLLSSVSMADLTEGLVGYWPLDGDATDASGNGLDGTINGNVTMVEDRNGNADSAMLFPGEEASHVSIADDPQLNIIEDMTLAAWVIADAAMQGVNNGRILSKQAGGGARSWNINTENASLPASFQISPDGSSILAVDGEPLPTGEWAHIAGVYRQGKSIEVYLNGELSATNDVGVPDEQFSANGQPVLIGARNACGNCGWLGAIDDVVIYERALEADEISLLMGDGPFAAAVEPGGKLTSTWGAIKY